MSRKSATELLIPLPKKTDSVYSSSFRAKRFQISLEQDKFHDMTKDIFFEPAIAQQASPIVFVLKKVRRLQFLVEHQ